MIIYDGNKFDTTNFSSKDYLKVNSCGVQHTALEGMTTLRDIGREDYLILLMCKGDSEVYYGETKYTLKIGNLVIYPPHAKQKYVFSPESSALWCHFTGYAAEEILASYGINCGVHAISANNTVIEKFLALIRKNMQSETQALSNPALLELLFYISRTITNQEKNDIPKSISSTLDFIHLNYHKEISLDTLSKLSGYSKSRFSHLFSEAVGSAPKQYVNELRLKSSLDMLLSTKLSVGEISSSCGFADQLYFCKLFKKKYGISPSQYRKGK